jgi:rod shape-determining protein MreC
LATQTHHGARRRYVLVIIVLTAFTLATLDQRSGDSGALGSIGRIVHRVVQPFSSAAATVFSPVQDWWDGVIHSGDLKSENKKLREELQQAKTKAALGQAAIAQNEQLNELFGKPFLDAYKWVGGSVAFGSSGNFGNTFTIDVGTERKIVPGMAVIAADGLVGRVRRVWNGGSEVERIDDPGFAAAIRMARTGTFGVATTQPDGSLKIDFSTDTRGKSTDFKVGDIAYTCGCEDSTLPAGIPLGTVTSVERNGPATTVHLQRLVDLPSVDAVKVLMWVPGQRNLVAVPITTTTTTSTTTTTTTVPGQTTTTAAGQTSTSTPSSSSPTTAAKTGG